jgi:nucleotide-binding universal stress UspA family protein
MYDHLARQDFSRARRKALWQKLRNWFTGKDNELLPFDEVRQSIPIQGQRYRGLQTIPIAQIVGSAGRYHEFNRTFLPMQAHTQNRWINIGRARYADIPLPPIEVYKIGEVYFVKDGNHRVSVARQRGQAYMDAYVTEIDIPVSLTADTRRADLRLKQETAAFLEKTGLHRLYPDAGIELTLPGEYQRLLEHIQTHRFYLSKNTGQPASFPDAVRSWYENVYLPLAAEIGKQDLARQFPHLSTADLYLLVSEYQWLLREAYTGAETNANGVIARFAETLQTISPDVEETGRELTRSLKHAAWLDDIILQQERAHFRQATSLDIEITLPGKYEKILRHISDHRWYLGIEQNREIPWHNAVASWHANIFTPIAQIIHEQDILPHFPGRTEGDLYIWLMDHKHQLSRQLGWDISPQTAARDLLDTNAPAGAEPAPRGPRPPRKGPSPQLYADLLVPIGHNPADWRALDQALLIASRGGSRLHGLHVIPADDHSDDAQHASLSREFAARCAQAGVSGRLAIEHGSISRNIARRARWVDLIILNLEHPPASAGLRRLSSGIPQVLRRSGRPVLFVPDQPTDLQSILLAYDASPKADEALYLAARMAQTWQGTRLTILTAAASEAEAAEVQQHARAFLLTRETPAEFRLTDSAEARAILNAARSSKADLIMLGGYGNSPILEMVFSSTVDKVLQKSRLPVLIRT